MSKKSPDNDLEKRLKELEKTLEEKIRTMSDRSDLERLLDNSPDLIFRLDRQLRHLYVNHAVLEATGLSREDYLGKTNRDLKMPDDLCDLWERLFSETMDTETPREAEFTYTGPQGPKYYQIRVVPERDAGGKVTSAVGISRDMTAHKRIEEKIRDLAKFPMENPHPVLRVTRGGRLLYANRSSRLLLDMWRCDVGQSLPGDWRQILKGVLKSGEPKVTEVGCGGRILSLTWTPVKNATYVNIYGLDVTAQKETEARLMQSEERYALAQRAAEIGSWEWDIETGTLQWSEMIEPLFGFASGKFRGTYEAFLGIVHPEDRQKIEDAVEDSLNEGQDYYIEHRIVRPNGRIRWLLEIGDVIRDKNGKAVRMLGTVQDITRRKTAEEALKRHEEQLESLVRERTKKLNCLYSLSKLVEDYDTALGDILQRIPDLLASASQYSSIAWARVSVDSGEFRTENFRNTEWNLSAPIIIKEQQIGFVEVGYLEDRPVLDEGPFSRDEKSLLHAVAERIGRIVEHSRVARHTEAQLQQFVAVFDSLVDSLYVSDPKTYQVLAANTALQNVLGENPVGKLCYQVLQGLDAPCDFCNNDIILRERKPYTWEYHNPVVDRTFLVTDQIIRWPDSRDVRLEVAVDITERKLMEQEISRTTTLQENILSSLDEAVLVIDPVPRTIISCNTAAEMMFGYWKEEMIGQSTEFLHVNKKNYRVFGKDLFAALDTGGVFRTEFNMRRKSGEVFPTDHTVKEIRDGSGRRAVVVSVVRDMTNHKKAMQKLQRLSKKLAEAQEEERKRLARELHDDVAGKLTAIKFGLQKKLGHMRKGYVTGDVSLEQIIQMVHKTVETTRRISSRLRPSELDDLGILKALRAYCREFQSLCDNIQIEMRFDLREEEIPEPLKIVIFRIVQEALTNAGKYSGANRIRISLRERESKIQLLIEDNGQGFEPAAVKEEKDSGPGMGLESMRERAELSGGSFVQWSATGHGTAIQVSWPRSTKDVEGAVKASMLQDESG